MKKTFTLLSLTCLVISAFAQQPQNGGFENWTPSTLYYNIAPYMTTGLQSYFVSGSGNVNPVPSPVQGVQAAQLATVTDGNDTVYGGMFYGVPNQSNSFDGGGAYNERPDSLVFWANHNMMPNDTGVVVVAFEFMNTLIGFGIAGVAGNSGGWIRYAVPITFQAPVNPDSICCMISSANILNGSPGIPGSVFEIDAIELIGAAAQIPNQYFETWNPQVVSEPDGWATLNFGNIYDGNYSVTPDNAAYMGNYDCRIETTVAEWGDTVGYITNGGFTGPNGPSGGMAVYQNPEKITGYYRYIPVGNDTAIAGGWTTRWDIVGDTAIPYEEVLTWLMPTTSWTYFEVNLSYNAFPYPDTLTIAFASSNFENYLGIGIGSQLFLDEIGVSYYPLGMEDVSSTAVTVFPNPATRFLNVRLEEIAAGENTFSVYDAQGKLVKSEQIVNGGQTGFYTMELSELPAGTYVWEIAGGKGKTSSTFVKQ